MIVTYNILFAHLANKTHFAHSRILQNLSLINNNNEYVKKM